MTPEEFRAVVTGVDANAAHYEQLIKDVPYTVWAETGERTLFGDDAGDSAVLQADVDYFTATEYDAKVDEWKAAFDAHDIAYAYSCEFDAETRTIHHHFECEGM